VKHDQQNNHNSQHIRESTSVVADAWKKRSHEETEQPD
jgi:hypothetical protein